MSARRLVWSGVASASIGVLCWIKVLFGLSGPLSVASPLPYRTLVVVLVPLALAVWLRGLGDLQVSKLSSVAIFGVRIAGLGIVYVVLAGLEQYFVDVISFSIPWAGAGYVLVILGVLMVGTAVLLAQALPVWSRALPLALGVPLPLIMLAEVPQDSGLLWTFVTLVLGTGFLVLGGVLSFHEPRAAGETGNAA
jgi:hypothetical protein